MTNYNKSIEQDYVNDEVTLAGQNGSHPVTLMVGVNGKLLYLKRHKFKEESTQTEPKEGWYDISDLNLKVIGALNLNETGFKDYEHKDLSRGDQPVILTYDPTKFQDPFELIYVKRVITDIKTSSVDAITPVGQLDNI